MSYTYTIFDANPATSSGTAWDTHQDIEIEADSDEEAIEQVRDVLSNEAAGLSPDDGYSVGQQLYALVWDENGIEIGGNVTHTLTVEDLGADKSQVPDRKWESVAAYVSTFTAGDGEGACDVDVQIGSYAGVWFVRTRDDAGGSDEADDTAYDTREEAEFAAEHFAVMNTEAEPGEDAEDYLARQERETAGEPDTDGEWCVYWETVGDDAGPRERYESEQAATAAANIANKGLRAHHRGDLLCGFGVRRLVDGEWLAAEER